MRESTYHDCSYYKPLRDSVGYCMLNESLCEVDAWGEICQELEELRDQDEIEYMQKNVGG